MAPHVRVLAISFLDASAASRAAAMLTRVFAPVGGVLIAPLGRARYPAAPETLLTAHLADDVVAAVRGAVEAAGGTIEMDVAEDDT